MHSTHASAMRSWAAALRHARLSAGCLVEHYGSLRRDLAPPLFRNGHALMLNTGIAGLLGFVYGLFVARHCPAADVGRASADYATMGLLSGFTAHNILDVLTRFIAQRGRRTGAMVGLVYVCSSAASVAITIPFLLTIGHWGRSIEYLAGLVRPALLVGR